MNKEEIIKPVKGRYAWVEYECGCAEGIWVGKDEVCAEHKKKIIKVSNTISLSPPKDLTKLTILKFKFLKDYKNFKKGMYLEVPAKRYSGQIELMGTWLELKKLLKNKCIEEARDIITLLDYE